MKTAAGPDVGATYQCPVCGACVTVMRPGSPDLRPRCCGVDMAAVEEEPLQIYFCPVCGAEVTVLKDNPEQLRPICCGVRMIRKKSPN